MKEFLLSVDKLKRDPSFYQSIIDVFAHNDIHYPVDLVGADISSMVVPTPHETDEGEVVVLSTGKKSFITRVAAKADQIALSEQAANSLVLAQPSSQSSELVAFVNALKKEPKKVHVDLVEKLKHVSLASLHRRCWPKGSLVDELATDIGKLREKGITSPFVFVDLRKFLPPFALDFHDEVEESEEEKVGKDVKALAKALGAKEKTTKYLSMIQWFLAFDKYAVAAAVTDQLPFTASFAYKNTVSQVGVQANTKYRSYAVAIYYDEIVRKRWAELTYGNDDSLDIVAECTKINEDALQEAQAKFEAKGIKSRLSTDTNWHSGQAWSGHKHHSGSFKRSSPYANGLGAKRFKNGNHL